MRGALQTQTKAAPASRPAFTPAPSRLLQRKCACWGASDFDGKCAECGATHIQRQTAHSSTLAKVPPIVHTALRSPGQPLDTATRAFMEPRFGHDFSQVRVHTDATAAESAQAVNARAYTVGAHIAFGAGVYAPETTAGRATLAHELAHTVQQGAAAAMPPIPDTLETTSPEDSTEQEARAAASAIMQGQPVMPTLARSPRIACEPPPGAPAPPAPAPAPPPPAPAVCANPGSPRRVDLQPIFFRSNAADPAPTGQTWSQRFLTATTIWDKLGVAFDEFSSITLEDATNKTAGSNRAERDTIRGLHSGAGIEVFMVDNDLADAGGGGTVGGGSDGAKMVLSDRGASDTLLAHELGHVLGLSHPPGGADPGTVMEPSGSNAANNPLRNTMGNYALIIWPPPEPVSVCLNPDP